MTLVPVSFRTRVRLTSINADDVLPISRMVDGTATSFSITWSDMSKQIVGEVNTARQAMVDGFSATQTQFSNMLSWAQAEIDGKAPMSHTHAIADVTGLSIALASKATPADISAAVNALIASSPGTMDTLKEIADALGDDPNFAATMASALSQRVRVDAAQTFTTGQQLQGRQNIGLGNVDNTSDANKPVSSATQTALNSKANAAHTHAQTEVTNLPADLAARAMLFNSGAAVSAPKLFTASKALTVAGSVIFYLTTDGTSSGTAIFATSVLNIQPVVNDASTVFTFAWSLSGDRKTLTMTVNKSATPLLSLLGINILAAPAAAPIGAVVGVLVVGS